ncbi:MAG TPA: acetyl-CoA carboxylase biotin carboxyl carrier protein [Candidatus Baltobacteraceae bacterium]|jgi:acetyl-CoA carboxylase biotin carboxyl carrier protein|nr:acetyl-CoA carboxylase biotin carboxyl carrier protein [Candidatus Baltobacteraceae bacterium]
MDRSDRDTETLNKLLALMHEHDLDRLKVKAGDAVYEIVRREPAATAAPAPAVQPATSPAAAAEPAAAAPPNVKKVVAPLTGVFYRSSSPDAEAYVSVGDRVETGDVICILEAMKLFNEIQSDYTGTIARIVPGNGELVSQGEDLFWIEP